jgi:hypothetical protein
MCFELHLPTVLQILKLTPTMPELFLHLSKIKYWNFFWFKEAFEGDKTQIIHGHGIFRDRYPVPTHLLKLKRKVKNIHFMIEDSGNKKNSTYFVSGMNISRFGFTVNC